MSHDERTQATTAGRAGDGAPPGPAARFSRARSSIRRRRTLNGAYRVGVAVVGSAVTIAGLAMLALPGPGWAAIFVGLAILATEFSWARRLLRRAKEAYERGKEKALDPRVRRRNKIIGAVAAVVLVALAAWWVARYGVPFL